MQDVVFRKRKLPDISHASQHRRAAAERVAVNTKVTFFLNLYFFLVLLMILSFFVRDQVQGSAADLVKAAMVKVEEGLRLAWPHRKPLKWCRRRQQWSTCGASLALQLHDELYYEVVAQDSIKVAQIVTECMENAMELSVPFPVKVKIGPSWGQLVEMCITNTK